MNIEQTRNKRQIIEKYVKSYFSINCECINNNILKNIKKYLDENFEGYYSRKNIKEYARIKNLDIGLFEGYLFYRLNNYLVPKISEHDISLLTNYLNDGDFTYFDVYNCNLEQLLDKIKGY